MELHLSELNPYAIIVSVIAGQILSTVWFVVLFADPWAREYGVETGKQHTAEIPGYTYGVQFLCTVLMTVTLAIAHRAFGVQGLVDGLVVGGLVAVGFCIATGLPGQAFLKRWSAAAMALGSQVVMILAASIILAVWQ